MLPLSIEEGILEGEVQSRSFEIKQRQTIRIGSINRFLSGIFSPLEARWLMCSVNVDGDHLSPSTTLETG